MVTDDASISVSDIVKSEGQHRRKPGRVRKVKTKCQLAYATRIRSKVDEQYVSRHFRKAHEEVRDRIRNGNMEQSNILTNSPSKASKNACTAEQKTMVTATLSVSSIVISPRVYYGLNVDELSSDSDLTDVPDDIGPDPFSKDAELSQRTKPTTVVKIKKARNNKKVPTKSPYFPPTLTQGYKNKQRLHFLSTLPFPALSEQTFGLMQERLAHQPFKLLIATIFLNKTPGARAMPVFYDLMKRYPTPENLATAEVSDVTAIIHHLGFQNQRARKCVAMAKEWVRNPPSRGKRYRKLNYPIKGDGRNVGIDEIVPDENDQIDNLSSEYNKENKVAWEISHLPGLGPYSHDSWRMFCRDELRGLASDWLGTDSALGDSNGDTNKGESEFEPEWKRVLPMDKELRAYLTWMWLKEGWVWNKETGARTRASKGLMEIAKGGGVVIEQANKETLEIKGIGVEETLVGQTLGKVEKTAGDFLP